MNTEQMQLWDSEFGAAYSDRNTFSVQELDEIYKEQYGYTRTEMNHSFLGQIELDKILEVGCNVGNQLRNLQHMGFSSLFGVELQSYAVEKAKQLSRGINIIQGHAYDVPFRDNYFDLVYTSGVLIHIAPDDIGRAMSEIYRTSNKYIWGMEYFSETYEEKEYRGNMQSMWKTDFAQLYLNQFPDLKLVKEMKFPYLKNENVDHMFLLEKKR